MIFPCSKLNVRPDKQFEFDMPALDVQHQPFKRINLDQQNTTNKTTLKKLFTVQ
jgi:hypothetical protein